MDKRNSRSGGFRAPGAAGLIQINVVHFAIAWEVVLGVSATVPPVLDVAKAVLRRL